MGDLLCQFSDDLCIDSLKLFTLNIPVPDKVIEVLGWIRESLEWTFVGPLIGIPIICLIQMVLFIKGIKTHLKQMYKGNCGFVVRDKSIRISNNRIAIGSFHFGG